MAEPMVVKPVTLTGRHARLEPISQEHLDDLTVAASDRAIWRYIALDPSSKEAVRTWIDKNSIAEREAGSVLRFTIVNQATGLAVGSTSLFEHSAKRPWFGDRVDLARQRCSADRDQHRM